MQNVLIASSLLSFVVVATKACLNSGYCTAKPTKINTTNTEDIYIVCTLSFFDVETPRTVQIDLLQNSKFFNFAFEILLELEKPAEVLHLFH